MLVFCSDAGPVLEMSVVVTLWGGQFTLLFHLVKPNYLIKILQGEKSCYFNYLLWWSFLFLLLSWDALNVAERASYVCAIHIYSKRTKCYTSVLGSPLKKWGSFGKNKNCLLLREYFVCDLTLCLLVALKMLLSTWSVFMATR